MSQIELRLHIAERREIERAKRDFVAIVSHGLRTRLTSIRGSLGLIEGGVAGEVSPKVSQMVGIARANADRLIRLVNDMLDLSKIEAGGVELQVVPLIPGSSWTPPSPRFAAWPRAPGSASAWPWRTAAPPPRRP